MHAVGLSEAARGTGSMFAARPGFVKTKMTAGLPRPRRLNRGAVADAVISGISMHGQTIIWAPGPLRFIFAIFRLLPQFVCLPG